MPFANKIVEQLKSKNKRELVYGDINLTNDSIVMNRFRIQYPKQNRGVIVDPFSLRAGEWLGISGPSGTGKTSFLRGFLSMLIDNKQGNQLYAKHDDKFLGYLPQIPQLFDGTIVENIAFGDNNSTVQINWIVYLLELVGFKPQQIRRLIDSKPDTLRLSGGEVQKVVFARTLYRKPMCLILDEPFTGIDHDTVQLIIKNLKQQAWIKFVIVATHRHSILQHCRNVLHYQKHCVDNDYSFFSCRMEDDDG